MTARAAITIADSVPANRVFHPTQDNQKGIAYFYNRAGGIAAGYDNLQIQLVEPPAVIPGRRTKNAADRLYRATVRVVLPTLETVSNNSAGYVPAPSPAYHCQAVVTFTIPERASLLERKDLLALTKNALAHAVVTALVENLEGIY